ncbi:MAG: hypothetical protein LBS26_01365 [Campylobacteraceae bacterium]|jgi:hypothetical protein|nr:hypothetical protein [Campylobacteraceae bacterium]
MEIENMTENIFKVFRISWTSYVGSLIRFSIQLAILYGIYYLLTHKVHEWIKFSPNTLNIIMWIVVGFAAVRVIFFIIDILHTRSVVLYTNDDGVWVYSGIFPWSKGSSGVKWRDIDEASFQTGFTSWLLKTYDIRVGHRFTKDSEIMLHNIFNGHEAVMHINKLHKKFTTKEQIE